MKHIATSMDPRLLVVLLDQSSSMSAAYDEKMSMAEKAACLVNDLIAEIIKMNVAGPRVKNRCVISVICYNNDYHEICSGWLTDLCEHPLRFDTVKQKLSDGTGGLIEVESKCPIWVEANANGGKDAIIPAMENVKSLCQSWFADGHITEPLILHVTNGVNMWHISQYTQVVKEMQQLNGLDSVIMAHLVVKNDDEKNNSLDKLFELSALLDEGDVLPLQKNCIDNVSRFYMENESGLLRCIYGLFVGGGMASAAWG